jgi:hypothetical protein
LLAVTTLYTKVALQAVSISLTGQQCLFIFFPVGLYAMWKNEKFSNKTKWITTSCFAILFLISSQFENNTQNTNINNELPGINSETIQSKTLKWYKSLSADNRKTLVEATVRDSNWGIESTNDYYNCMGDFAFSKSEDLTYVEVIKWCRQEYENNLERFQSHFNELEAKDLSSQAAVMCQNVVENQLKSPATADFPWLDRSIYKKGKWRYVIKSYVDSQNSFGATIRTNWHCDIQYKGEGEPLNGSSWTLHALDFQ